MRKLIHRFRCWAGHHEWSEWEDNSRFCFHCLISEVRMVPEAIRGIKMADSGTLGNIKIGLEQRLEFYNGILSKSDEFFGEENAKALEELRKAREKNLASLELLKEVRNG